MTQPTLSLIVPMYNARQTIGPCLQSILEGITAQVEVILVDDGSTDGSADHVLKEFAAAFVEGSLILEQQTNRGVSTARNVGIEKARGKYLGFVDADDMIHRDYFGHLLNEIASSAADIIEFGFHSWNGVLPAAPSTPPLHAISRFGRFRRQQIEFAVYGSAMWYPWSRIFKRDLFEGIRFPENVHFCEDLMTIAMLYPRARTVCNLPYGLYHYRNNPAGATMTARPNDVTALTAFYLSILQERGTRFDLLKIATQFAIYSCQQTMGLPYELDPRLESDLSKVRRNVSLYRYLHHRRMRILWFPALNRQLSRLKARTLRNGVQM